MLSELETRVCYVQYKVDIRKMVSNEQTDFFVHVMEHIDQ